MKFIRAIDGFDHLWSVWDQNKDADELTMLFRNWTNVEYLLDFFMQNMNDLKRYFHIERLDEAINDTFEDAETLQELVLDMPFSVHLDDIFKPLAIDDSRTCELSREKARNWDRERHASWLRIYAIRLEPNVYIVTGGAIKLTRTMQEREHTAIELQKLNRCKAFLKANGVFDKDSFVEFSIE